MPGWLAGWLSCIPTRIARTVLIPGATETVGQSRRQTFIDSFRIKIESLSITLTSHVCQYSQVGWHEQSHVDAPCILGSPEYFAQYILGNTTHWDALALTEFCRIT
jgi:hypothetical protein